MFGAFGQGKLILQGGAIVEDEPKNNQKNIVAEHGKIVTSSVF